MTREDELNEAWCKYRGKCSTEIIQALSFALRWCDEHPHWISVEDELPKNKELVFITDGEVTDMGFYDYTDDAWQPFERWLGDITHWMPTPQPPKKGGEQ